MPRQEVDSTRTLLDRVEQRFRLKPVAWLATPRTARERCWARERGCPAS